MHLLLYEWYVSGHPIPNFTALMTVIRTVCHCPFSCPSNLVSALILYKSPVIYSIISQTTTVNSTQYHAMEAQRGCRSITPLIFNLGVREGWVVNAIPRPLYTRTRVPVFIQQEAKWSPGRICTGMWKRTSLVSTGFRSRPLYYLYNKSAVDTNVQSITNNF
jgi:hypothetical protein